MRAYFYTYIHCVYKSFEKKYPWNKYCFLFLTCIDFPGMVLFAVSAFSCTLPHYFFGNQLLHANNAFYGGGFGNNNNGISSSLLLDPSLNGTLTNRSDSHLNLCRVTDSNNMSVTDKG